MQAPPSPPSARVALCCAPHDALTLSLACVDAPRFMTLFDADNSGDISFTEFNNLMGRVVNPSESGVLFGQKAAPRIQEWAEAKWAKQLVADAGGSIERAFTLVDTDNSGACSHLHD